MAALIDRIARTQASLALMLSLARLLVPCLVYRGSGRHLVVEEWSEADLRGDTLVADVRTAFSRDLAAEQAREYAIVAAGRPVPRGSLAELFWKTQTCLPPLPGRFEDPELSRFGKALYFYLVPEGQDLSEVDSAVVAAKVEACRKDGFAALNLNTSPRKLQRVFRKLLAVTVRWCSQLTGAAATELVERRLAQSKHRTLNSAERALIELRDGSCRALGDINVGFLFGCGPLLSEKVNAYFRALAELAPPADCSQAEEDLRKSLSLLGGFQERRKRARAEERRSDRQHYADRMPRGQRRGTEKIEDRRVNAPDEVLANSEAFRGLEALLPCLKPRDAGRLRALIDCRGDREAAAALLGLDLKTFSRQLRQTVFPALRRIARQDNLEPQ